MPVWEKNPGKCTLLTWFNNATAGGSVNLHVSLVRLIQCIVSSHSLIPPVGHKEMSSILADQ
jgi:hypothetical protein